MFGDTIIDTGINADDKGSYVCSNCGSNLFNADSRFEAGCGFPSFWIHLKDKVELRQLNTYGRERTQLLCNNCKQHLGHLFYNKHTPTKKRYCINAGAIVYKPLNIATMDNDKDLTKDKNGMVEDNQVASAENEKIGEAEIRTYNEVVPGGEAKEDIEEIQSTDDV